MDDRPANREYLVTLLGYGGHRLFEAPDGEVALALAQAERPDLIIADIIMPAMDGYELARQIRADPGIAETQIIFFTSSFLVDETRRLANACGVNHIITKPAEPQTILDTVGAALRTTQVLPALPVPEEFHRDHMRILTDTLAKRVEELEQEIAQRKQREREIEAIAAVSVALRTANTQAQMLPIILDQVAALVNAGGAALAMRHPASDELEIALAQGEMDGLAGLLLPAGAGVGGQALATGQPYTTDDITADPHWYQQNWTGLARSAACVPLITSQHVLGVLWAVRTLPFTAVEVRVLSAIAGIAASAIQRAGLYEQTEQRLQRLAALREIDNAIMHSLDLGTTLGLVLGHVTAQLSVDAADILLLSRGLNVLEYAAGRGFHTKTIEQTRQRLGEGHAGQAALERRVVVVPDLQADSLPFRRTALLAAESFRALYCLPLLAKGQVVGVLEVYHRTPLNPDGEWLSFLETLAGQSAIAVADAWLFADLQRSNTELLVAYDTTLEGWSAALDLRDKETEGHSQRVTDMTLLLAQTLGVRDGELEQMRRGALLHDIGKMGIPDSILLKPDTLTAGEWEIMRQHPRHAYELLGPIAFLRQALDIPYCHHEKWDGTGYPRQLRAEAIPLSARIFAVVDVWDALRSYRPYRRGWAEDKVLEYIRGQSGQHFEPRIVEVFLALLAQRSAPVGKF